MTTTLYVIKEEKKVRKIKKSLSFLDAPNSNEILNRQINLTPCILNKCSKQMSPYSGSIHFAFDPFNRHQLNTIEKSLIKQKHRVISNEVKLLSIELDLPLHSFRSKKMVQETPLLVTKMNKNQMRLNRMQRNLSVSDESGYSDSVFSAVSTPLVSTFENTCDRGDTIKFMGQDLEQVNSQFKTRRCMFTMEVEEDQAPCAPPNCIQSLVEMVKLLKTRLSFNKMHPTKPIINTDVNNSAVIRRQRYLHAY